MCQRYATLFLVQSVDFIGSATRLSDGVCVLWNYVVDGVCRDIMLQLCVYVCRMCSSYLASSRNYVRNTNWVSELLCVDKLRGNCGLHQSARIPRTLAHRVDLCKMQLLFVCAGHISNMLNISQISGTPKLFVELFCFQHSRIDKWYKFQNIFLPKFLWDRKQITPKYASFIRADVCILLCYITHSKSMRKHLYEHPTHRHHDIHKSVSKNPSVHTNTTPHSTTLVPMGIHI